LTPSPIHKALLTIRNFGARYLVMGGQACVLYGAAEFSRDLDLALAADADNLQAIRLALDDLKAVLLFVPDLDSQALERGHACHFSCHRDDVEGLRIDMMSKMRGCGPFEDLWRRRTTVELPDTGPIALMSLPDVVQAKKTQRDKDWPMIRRLVEASYHEFGRSPSPERIAFWLRECRTPSLLASLARQHREECEKLTQDRPLLRAALAGDVEAVEAGLAAEEKSEREADKQYWTPLKKELEQWRRKRRREG